MTTMFVMTHKPFQLPREICNQENGFIPLHVGRANGVDLGYMGDDTGDSISQLNGFYGELTGLYWIWRNYEGQENVGVCHYRRYFCDAHRRILSEEELDLILADHDVITTEAFDVAEDSYRDMYAKSHYVEDLDEAGKVIEELYPQDYEVFQKVLNGRTHYKGNLMATSRALFDAYCEWLFSIFSVLQERIDYDKYEDAYHRRVFGFLSEQLLKVWVNARRLKVYECKTVITDEKAETKELKLALAQMIKHGSVKEARSFYYQLMGIRPDVRLEESDLRNELFAVEQILYICELEQEQQIKGLLDYSKDLQMLIRYFQQAARAVKENDEEFLREHPVSEIAKEVILLN